MMCIKIVCYGCGWARERLRIALLLLTFTLYLYSHHLSISLNANQQNNNHPTRPLQTAHTADHPTQYITMFYSLSTLLRVLVASAASIPFVAAQNQTKMVTTDDLYGTLSSTTAAPPGFNAEGGSVFTNFVNAVNDKQFFLLIAGSSVYEKPGSEPAQSTFLDWCSDLTFSDLNNSSLMGLAGRCVSMRLAGYAAQMAAGAQLLTNVVSEGEFTWTSGISAVYVEQQNIFQGQLHSNTDDWVYRYWDDGRKTMPYIGWEGHDEGDTSANAATASWSSFGEFTWMPVEEVAQLLNTSTDKFTPEKFKQVYLDAWIKTHEQEAAEDNPNPEAEQEIIEEAKGETDSTGETTTPAEPADTKEDGTDGANPIDDSASGRKLVSVAARFVSAALRAFGI